jgi:L-lysine 6-transaminase
MNNSSLNKIKIDFARSHDSYIFDLNTDREYLDMMGMYSTLAVGYNNENVYSEVDANLLNNLFKNKITNCEINSSLLQDFICTFHRNLDLGGMFPNSYFCPTGALAIEASIKTALRYKNLDNPRILAFKGSFHGVYGFGGILTDRFDSVNPRLKNFPGGYYNTLTPHYDERKSGYLNLVSFEESIERLKEEFSKDKNLAAVIVEPVQCTFGDQYLDSIYILKIRELCNEYDIPLIFDEIQTGFYTSGKKWFSEVLGVYPDIIVFGKKLQVAGILINKKCNKIFEIPATLEATWDSNLIDMYRSKIIIEYFEKNSIEEEIKVNSEFIENELKHKSDILNYRSCGYLISFDFVSNQKRNEFVEKLKCNGVLCNPTRDRTVRFRPHLLASKKDFEKLVSEIQKS